MKTIFRISAHSTLQKKMMAVHFTTIKQYLANLTQPIGIHIESHILHTQKHFLY